MKISRLEAGFNYAVLSLFTISALLPLVGVVLSALTPRAEATGGLAIPSSLAWSNFKLAWAEGHFTVYMRSSVIVTVAVVAITVVLASAAGYGFARLDFPGATPVFFLLLIGLMLPAEAFIIPLYYNLRGMGLTNTYWGLIAPQVAQSLAFGTFWMRNNFKQFPTSIIEAARLDGASEWALMWRVALPALRPAVLTMCLLLGMWTWNEFLIPLVMVTDESLRTAPLGMAFFQGRRSTDYALLAAGGMIVAAPVVIAYSFAQKHFVRGMLGGASR
ncbi:MAG: carbohydrate ABC transporter permease [Actinobacteria bacterium]|nr:carbohydrate ABC transporter permease [Actinomycetota bacterium]MCG2801040.1 carbohydrate ABC transporter permease [Cellulomonas sp.]